MNYKLALPLNPLKGTLFDMEAKSPSGDLGAEPTELVLCTIAQPHQKSVVLRRTTCRPTMLKRVSIQNFKSLKDVTLDLQKVNLLIGPNNSGKTNFLKALERIKDIFGDKYSIDINDLYRKSLANRLSLELIFEGKPSGSPDGQYTHFIFRDYGFEGDNYGLRMHQSKTLTLNDLSYTQLPDMGKLLREFSGISYTYKPDPNKLIQYNKFSASETTLNADCSNLIAFYYFLDTNYKRKNAQTIQDEMNTCIPEFTYFTLPPVRVGDEDLLGLQFFDKEDVGYWASEVSEGVIYFLALLTIINQPNPPKLLLLEEPEKGIHPRRIREVMDFIFRLAEEKDIQIILTTHNEHVLDDFATRPESVFVFDKDEEGATYVRNLQKDIIEPTNKQNEEMGLDPIDLTTNLSENWLYGLLGGVPSII